MLLLTINLPGKIFSLEANIADITPTRFKYRRNNYQQNKAKC